MKRHLLYSFCLFFLGVFIFCSCGGDGKAKSNANSASTPEVKIDSKIDTEIDSTEIKALLAQANEKEEMQEEAKEEKSFNPPHIPVFKEEKVEPKKNKAQKEEINTPSKPEAKSKVSSPVVEREKVNKISPQTSKKTKEVKKSVVNKANGKDTEIVWRRNFYSFGDIIQGDTVYFKFEFTNIGEHPLEIEDVKVTCGCTHPSFSFLPVQPNEKGEITGMYISDETKKGKENAMIKVIANTDPSQHKLYIDGNVLLPEGNSKDDGLETKGN